MPNVNQYKCQVLHSFDHWNKSFYKVKKMNEDGLCLKNRAYILTFFETCNFQAPLGHDMVHGTYPTMACLSPRSGLSFKFNVKAFYYIAPSIPFSTPSQTSQATSFTWGWHQKSGPPTDTNSERVWVSQERLCYSMVAIRNSEWPNQQEEFLSLVLSVPPRSAVALLHIVFTLDRSRLISFYLECCWSSGQQER